MTAPPEGLRDGPDAVPEGAPRNDLEAWRLRVSAALADPKHVAFVASWGIVFIIAGAHTDTAFCWCQPTYETRPHGDHDHRISYHRETMD